MRDAPLDWRTSPVRRAPHEKMLPLLRMAVAAAPDRPDLKVKLALALFKTDRMTELVDWLRPAAADEDADPELLMCLGEAAIAIRDHQLALTALRSAAAKEFTPAFGRIAETLARLGRPDEALEIGLEALARLPTDSKAFAIVARVLLDRAEAERLWALCSDIRARGAWRGYIPSAMALAAATAADRDEVAALVDPARWFSATRLAVPEGFNDRLAAELLKHPFMRPVPRTRATIGDTNWILQLQLAGGPLAQELLVKLREAVASYISERQAFLDHPFIARRPSSVDLNSWGLAVHDDGCQTWHLHDGWLTGVYYVKMPGVEPYRDGHPGAGAIEFGLYPFGRQAETLRSPRWRVMPEPGLLLLCPSYFAHRTWPTGVGEPRVCVAFDVKPSETMAQGHAVTTAIDEVISRRRTTVEINYGVAPIDEPRADRAAGN